MPLFFFHYHTADEISRDDVGCRFETLDLAYLDAHRSMIEIGADLLRRQQNPAGHWIEIADTDDRVLMKLHFDEIFRRPPRISPQTQTGTLRAHLGKLQRLRDEMHGLCAEARASVARAHETLRRARSIT